MLDPSLKHQNINNTWTSYTEVGNAHFKNGNYLAAQSFYEQALTLKKQLLQTDIQQTQAPETIHLFVVQLARWK
ncbi:tetratricopeptide repeat protein [Gloeocapsa sp. PCC 73106]|uniref:tetratricopeptide repeat protein n=1 Tax=Gloeocapsa sp. PCC 73106 TaxID=102232 RepID=UPI0002AC013C|nr:tetratricopeptide repeat protein [Gloeocapsa sp. PCC 73106]ELR96636.1 tetratricopeptide repeat protein [Gloeocapsa sp. PCC 73106]